MEFSVGLPFSLRICVGSSPLPFAPKNTHYALAIACNDYLLCAFLLLAKLISWLGSSRKSFAPSQSGAMMGFFASMYLFYSVARMRP